MPDTSTEKTLVMPAVDKSEALLASCRRCGRAFGIGGLTRSPSNRDFCADCARMERSELTVAKQDNSNWIQLAREQSIPLWEQQPEESAAEFELWETFRDLWPGTRPTITKVSQIANVHISSVQRVFDKWTWTARLQSWIREVNADRRSELRESRRKMVEDHIALGEKMREKMLKAVEALDPEDVTPSELVSLLKETQRLEQTGRDSLEALEAEVASDIGDMPEGLFVEDGMAEERANSKGLTIEDMTEIVDILAHAGVMQVNGAKVGVRQTTTTEVVTTNDEF